jgi:hypothetical protein
MCLEGLWRFCLNQADVLRPGAAGKRLEFYGDCGWLTSNVLARALMRTLPAALVCSIALLIWCEHTFAQNLNLTRSAKSGLESLIAEERSWDQNCNARPITVIITKNPANGTISVVPGQKSIIPPSTPASGSTGACAGKEVTGNEIWYKSNAGFHGTDSVSYNVSNQSQRPREIKINVE